ncbi:ABC transporter permease [Microbacterium forte]|uniref:ABC transporter permease n=1 Tax=Microbacterium forte TaxID=2982533 RepID=UPI0028936E25|nr:ABC transporter permease [Microbacterium sp. A(2022)]
MSEPFDTNILQLPRTRSKNFLSRPLVVVSLAVLLCALVVTCFAAPLAPYGLNEGVLADRLQPPNSSHWFGTDDLGRDVLSRTLYALQTSVLIAVTATILGGIFGSLMGALAGWFGGAIDTVISFLIDVQASIPAFILALGAIVLFGGSPIALVVVLAIEGWERFARIMRGQVMLARTSGYATSAVNLGVPTSAVLIRHIAPAVAGPMLVQLTQALPTKILIESALSFLGLGISAPQTSLGQMVGAGRDYLTTAGWIALVPGLVIIVISVAISLIGDQLQDRLVDRA